MISSALREVSGVSCASTLTFGLRSSMRSRAESSLRLPIALVPWSTCRCRFVASTTSKPPRPSGRIDVREPERAHPRCREVERCGRTEPAHADEQHAGALELLLSLESDLGK